MDHLFTPWRLRYVKGTRTREGGCIFCRAVSAPEDQESLVLYVGDHNFVLLNRYPYTSGHVMIAPRNHVADLSAMSPAARSELMELVVEMQRAIGLCYEPRGFNVGMNLGECAGAGIPDHLHVHVVPRWPGDTNFMTALAETRMVPEDLAETRRRLMSALSGDSVS